MNNTYSNTLQNNLSKHTVYNHEKYYGAIEDSFIRERSMV